MNGGVSWLKLPWHLGALRYRPLQTSICRVNLFLRFQIALGRLFFFLFREYFGILKDKVMIVLLHTSGLWVIFLKKIFSCMWVWRRVSWNILSALDGLCTYTFKLKVSLSSYLFSISVKEVLLEYLEHSDS